MAGPIEVFQDMYLRCPAPKRPELRSALIAAAVAPWHMDAERSEELAQSALTDDDVILFRRSASEGYPAAGLTLWEDKSGYYVPNIVPMDAGSLSYAQYNAILANFIDLVVAPVAARLGLTITTTAPQQTLDDWLSAESKEKLQRFSTAANKSTAASHPSDERRWFDFLVCVHRAHDKFDASTLARWLHESEGWDEDTSHKLAGDFEKAQALLAFYDEH
jgi:hypothetical protein